MPALDAARERITKDCSRRMGRQPTAADSGDWAIGVCVRNFIEHALRCGCDIAWLSRAREHDFFRRVSPMATAGGHGVLPSSLLPGSAYCGPDPFRATEHDQRWFLRNSRRTRR